MLLRRTSRRLAALSLLGLVVAGCGGPEARRAAGLAPAPPWTESLGPGGDLKTELALDPVVVRVDVPSGHAARLTIGTSTNLACVQASLWGDEGTPVPIDSSGVMFVPRPGRDPAILSVRAIDSTAVGQPLELECIGGAELDDGEIRVWERARILATLRRSVAAGMLPGAARLADRSATARFATRSDSLDHAAFLEEAAFAVAEADSLVETVEHLVSRSLELRQQCLPPADPLIAQSLTLLSTLHQNLGRYDLSAELQERAFRITSAAPEASAEGLLQASRELGVAYHYAGRFSEALECYRRALALDESLPPSLARRADLENNLGETLREIGSVHEARVHAQTALRLSLRLLEEARDPAERDEARSSHLAILVNLAGQSYDRGALVEAEQLYREALAGAGGQNLAPGSRTTILRGLADTLRLQGRLAEAVPVYEEARRVAESDLPANHLDHFWIPYQLADLEVSRGRLDEAAVLLQEAHRLLLAGGEAGRTRLHFPSSRLAEVRLAQGRAGEAAKLYDQALAAQKRWRGECSADYASAQVGLACALSERDGFGTARVQQLLGEALRRLEQTTERPEARIRAYRLQSEETHAGGDHHAAARTLATALQQVEALESIAVVAPEGRASFLEQYASGFHRLVEWAVDEGDLDLAFRTLDRSRSRVLAAMLEAQSRASASEPAGESEEQALRRFSEARARLDAVARRADLEPTRRETRLQELEREMQGAYLELLEAQSSSRARAKATDASPEPVGLEELQRSVLRPGEVLLVYQFSESRGLVLAATPGRPPIVRTLEVGGEDSRLLGVPAGNLNAEQLEGALLGGHRPLIDRLCVPVTDTDLMPRLAALRRALVPDDLWRDLQTAKRIFFVLDGALHRFPMEALVTDEGSYWMTTAPPIAYAPSPGVLARTRRSAPLRLASVACLGDPDFETAAAASTTPITRSAWTPGRLPASAQEIQGIARTLGGRTTLRMGRRATERELRLALEGYDVVHVAAHARVAVLGRGVTEAAVRLAVGDGTPGDDGYLDLAELVFLSATADLVVLSACETHRGGTYAGEGAYTLARGFLAAGVPRVVASLWAVEDEATAALMSAFYEELAAREPQGDLECSRALAEARRRLQQTPRWAAPCFWAPFVAIGAD